jgi:NADP-dependent 3-hydroxy acid dehydrogenase YdfG
MSGPVIFISGCSSGFGEALALEGLSRGLRVIATARKLQSLARLKAAGASVLELDVTWPDARMKDMAKEAFQIHQRIDFVVNNAGIVMMGNLEEFDSSDMRRIFETQAA